MVLKKGRELWVRFNADEVSFHRIMYDPQVGQLGGWCEPTLSGGGAAVGATPSKEVGPGRGGRDPTSWTRAPGPEPRSSC